MSPACVRPSRPARVQRPFRCPSGHPRRATLVLMPIERIIIGVDGSDGSRGALAWAADLAAALSAEVIAVHAVGLLEHAAPDEQAGSTGSERDRLADLFASKWCAPLDDVPGLRARRLMEDGPPAMVLLRVAESTGADLVVVGSRGIGGLDEVLLGSTSAHVVQHSNVPVTVIPRSASGEDPAS